MRLRTISQLVPKLRFPEFVDHAPWDARPLDNLCDRLTDTVGNAQLTPVSITAGNGFVPQAEKFGRDISGSQYGKYVWLQRGDFAYNRGNSKRFPQGCVYQLTGFDEAAASNAFHCFRLHGHLEPAFFLGFFEDNGHGRQLIRHITSSARSDGLLNISADTFFGITVPVPPTAAEQQKIADCLCSLNDLIAEEGRKLEALRKHKQGLMQHLFPQEGEAYPRLRFTKFRNAPEWVEKQLGDVSEVLMCKRIFASETETNGDVPFYKIGTLGGVPDAFISKSLFNKYKQKYNFPRTGEILITCSGTVGKCLPYDGKEAYFQDSNIVWIDNPKLEVSNEFLLSILTNVNWRTLNSTTISRIYGADLRGLAIKFPRDKREQQYIADCLCALDTLIGTQSAKLDSLSAHKQGLLQQLFPSLKSP